ncbi:MAG: hypothetical protein MMC33_007296, partial [Icmadophila ericetorum]|nr:hypothetical protein [Icmadophila ericetorum]
IVDGRLPAHSIPDATKESIVNRVRLPPSQVLKESILEEEEEILDTIIVATGEDRSEFGDNAEDGPAGPLGQEGNQPDDRTVEEDYEPAKALEETLLTPNPSEEEEVSALHVTVPVGEAVDPPVQCTGCAQDSAMPVDRNPTKISSAVHGAFAAGRLFKRYHKRQLPPVPSSHGGPPTAAQADADVLGG